MNNSKIKNYFFVAIAATSLALASCTSARELSYQSTGSIPPYSSPEVDDKIFTTTQDEPQADFSTSLSTAEDNSNESEITTGSLMLPSDLDNTTTTEIEPLITEANTDDQVELVFEDNEPVKKLQEERTHTEEIAQNDPAPAQTAEVLRTASPLIKPSNTPERSEPKQPITEKTNVKTEIQTNSTANLNRSPIAKPAVKTVTNNPENEHFTVIITTDGVGINSASILSQLEDAIASIQRGDHKDIVIDATQKQVNNQRVAEPVENDSEEFDTELVEILENEINKENKPNAPIASTQNTSQAHREVLTLAIGEGRSVVIDEGLLIEWENAIADKILGDPNDTDMPKWLLQGIEWITHAPTAEPARSQTIMPIYRHMEDAGILDDVDQSRMTPNQVVDKLRVFVDNAKSTR